MDLQFTTIMSQSSLPNPAMEDAPKLNSILNEINPSETKATEGSSNKNWIQKPKVSKLTPIYRYLKRFKSVETARYVHAEITGRFLREQASFFGCAVNLMNQYIVPKKLYKKILIFWQDPNDESPPALRATVLLRIGLLSQSYYTFCRELSTQQIDVYDSSLRESHSILVDFTRLNHVWGVLDPNICQTELELSVRLLTISIIFSTSLKRPDSERKDVTFYFEIETPNNSKISLAKKFALEEDGGITEKYLSKLTTPIY